MHFAVNKISIRNTHPASGTASGTSSPISSVTLIWPSTLAFLGATKKASIDFWIVRLPEPAGPDILRIETKSLKRAYKYQESLKKHL